jgi:preprotein translocase subunit SecE
MVDKLKIIVALALVAAGVAGFYYLSEDATIYRLLALAAGIAAGCAVAWFTKPGRDFFTFAQESWAETKKVVWPSRKETLQTTLVVIGFVLIMAVFLLAVDKSLEVVMYDWILGQGWTKS